MITDKEGLVIRKVRTAGETVGDTFAFLGRYYRPICTALLLYALPWILALGFVSAQYQGDIWESAMSFNPAYVDSFFDIWWKIFGANFFLTVTLLLVVSIIITIVSIESVLLVEEGKDITPGVILIRGAADLIPLLAVFIGTMVIFALGFMMLFIPGIYLIVVMSIIPVVRIRERKGFFRSMGRCLSLVRKNWWRTTGLIIIFGIIMMVISTILTIPNYFVMFFIMMHGLPAVDPALMPVVRVLTIAAQVIGNLTILLYVIPSIGFTLYYFSLVERKQAGSSMEAGNIGGAGRGPVVPLS